jgi:TolB-like protein
MFEKGTLMRFKRPHCFSLYFSLILCLIFISPPLSVPQARDPGKVYKVAILPFVIHSQENLDYLREGIYDMLSSRIAAEGNIIVLERTVVERAFYEERPMRLDETVAKKIGLRTGADYIVLGSITKIGDYISLDARLVSVTEEKPSLGAFTQHKGIEDVMLKLGDFAQDISYKILGRRATAGRPTGPRHPYLVQPKRELGRMDPEGLGFKKSQTFDFETKGLDIGDVDGDKQNELVIMDRHNLYIFKYDGEKMSLFRKIEAGSENNFLTLDVADVNQNGIAEIVVTSVVDDNLRSFILEYEEKEFRTVIEDANWYFRVLDHPKEGPILMGQRMGSDGLYSGPIYKFFWKEKTFERGPKMDFPRGTKVFGLTVADLRKQGNFDVVRLEDSERLSVLSLDGKFSWTSKGRYGGTNNYYDTRRKQDPVYRPAEAPPWRVRIPGRVLTKDLDEDGIKEIIVNRNDRPLKLLDRIRNYESGVIYSLIWQEGYLDTHWKTREINGYITDFQVKDVDNDGDDELVVAVVDLGSITDRKGTSNILFFELF